MADSLQLYNARQTKHPQTEKTPKDREIPCLPAFTLNYLPANSFNASALSVCSHGRSMSVRPK